MKILAIVTASLYAIGSALASSDKASTIILDNSTSLASSKSLSPTTVGLRGLTSDSTSILRHRALNIKTNRRWKDRSSGRVVIPYTISSSFGSADRSEIRSALDDLERRTGSLHFVQRTDQGHYIQVVRRSGSCSSSVGKRGGPQNLNLGENCMSKGTIQHEFLHAMGFHHEHTRPDRDQHVSILFDNIDNRKDREHNFDRNDDSETLGSPYDFTSVMHYKDSAFAKPGTKTIVPKNGNQIRRGDSASSLDIKKLKLLYQCERGIVRDWSSLNSSPCTSDCKCREGEIGCGSNNDACHGSLVCSSNKCVTASTQTYCGCSTCTQQVWDTLATNDGGSASCGSRISWVKENYGYSSSDACDFVTSEFPDICRCSSSACSGPPPSPSPYQLITDLKGPKCPNGLEVTENECKAAAGDQLGFTYELYQAGDWDYTPCGCFGWNANGRIFLDYDRGSSGCKEHSNVVGMVCKKEASPSPNPSNSFLIWQTLPDGSDDDFRCIDLRARDTSNGNDVWYYPCNFTPAQYWYRDYSTNYIRSSIDRNKCIVGASGSSAKGTRLVINDCHHNDDRFRWDKYTDGSIRPRNNNRVCIEADINAGGGLGLYLILDDCHDGYKTFHWLDNEGSGRRKLSMEAEEENTNRVLSPEQIASELDGTVNYESSDGCVDSPLGWFDLFGRNCEWYGQDSSNCAVYGDQYANFGKTALSACCVCGGGPSFESAADNNNKMQHAVDAMDQSCWDTPNWYDSTADGCIWYEEENNCEYFGDQFPSDIEGQTANEACCICGGGLADPPSSDDNAADAPGCSNSPFDWFDTEGLGCDWYELEERNCVEFGDLEGADGLSANQACCACGGGYNPNALTVEDEEQTILPLMASSSADDVAESEASDDVPANVNKLEDITEPPSVPSVSSEASSGDNSAGANEVVSHGEEDSGKDQTQLMANAKEDPAADIFANEASESHKDESSAVSLGHKFFSAALVVGALSVVLV